MGNKKLGQRFIYFIGGLGAVAIAAIILMIYIVGFEDHWYSEFALFICPVILVGLSAIYISFSKKFDKYTSSPKKPEEKSTNDASGKK